MSHAAMTWAQRARTGSGTRKCILLLMADGADEHGVLWWGLKKLVDYSELSRRTVITALQKLEEDGLILKIERRRENGTQRSSLYLLAPRGERSPMTPWEDGEDEHTRLIREALWEQGQGDAPGQPQGASGDAQGAPGAHQGAPGDQQGQGAAPLEPSLEPPSEPPLEPQTARGAPGQQELGVAALTPAAGRSVGGDVTPISPAVGAALDAVLPSLRAVAGTKRSIAVDVGAVLSMLGKRPNKPHARAAEAFEHYWLHGGGQHKRVKDVVATYRNWVDREPDIEPMQMHGAAAHSGTFGNARGPARTNSDRVRQNIDEARHAARMLREGSAHHDPR